jgi:hypothetical protein
MNAVADRFAALRDEVRALLEGERLRMQEEIRAYPTPIPRCDQQFNHLIAQREVLFSQLARLDAVTPASVGDGDSWWDAFVDSSELEADLKRRVKAALSQSATAESPGVAGG